MSEVMTFAFAAEQRNEDKADIERRHKEIVNLQEEQYIGVMLQRKADAETGVKLRRLEVALELMKMDGCKVSSAEWHIADMAKKYLAAADVIIKEAGL